MATLILAGNRIFTSVEEAVMALTNDEKTAVGQAIQAAPKPSKERITVRVDTTTFAVYQGKNGPRRRIGTVTHYVKNEANRTPTGGRYTSRRLTVRLRGDDRDWVGQFKKDEKIVVILHPRPLEQ
jgi:hypothetical protein